MCEPHENEISLEETSAEDNSEDQTEDGEPTEAHNRPLIRKKRNLIDVPQRQNIGADGNSVEEFN